MCICVYVSVCVRAVKEKRLKLSTPFGAHILYGSHLASLTLRSNGQRSRSPSYENCHGRMTANLVCCWRCVLLLLAWDCTSYDCLGLYLSDAFGMLVGKTARTVSSSTLNLATSLSCGVRRCRRTQPGTSRRGRGKPDDHR